MERKPMLKNSTTEFYEEIAKNLPSGDLNRSLINQKPNHLSPFIDHSEF